MLAAHPGVTCYHLPLQTQAGELEWKMRGCHVDAWDTLFFFWVGDDGRVFAWGSAWKVPDSNRSASLAVVSQHYTGRFKRPSELCPRQERLEGFRVWRDADYFVYAFADSEATKLRVRENIWVGARLGAPTCSYRDLVSVPGLR